MKQQKMFGDALWMNSTKTAENKFFILRRHFFVHKIKRATLRVVGLGFFHCYINGQRVGDDLFLPLNTDYEERLDFPVGEVTSGHRLYVPEYDITHFLKDGENLIAIHFGGGWYTYDEERKFGDAKVIWHIFGENDQGSFAFSSSPMDKIHPSFVSEVLFTKDETQNFLLGNENAFVVDFDDSLWDNAVPARSIDTEYQFSDCPADGVMEVLPVTEVARFADHTVYDCGKNISGYPVLRIHEKSSKMVRILLSEERLPNGELHPTFCHRQELCFISDGYERVVRPLFTWFGFRYFAVYGEAVALGVEVVHCKLDVTSSFQSDNETLNWIHDTFINTQLTNMHTGIPSDCPHLERRGYTGDGQLICHAAMNILDGERFYRKWMQDIADCQDQLSGHIQYTAPYTHSGGGPGGWGCAIVEVPYQFYMHYGDVAPLYEYYPNMLRYFDYLESHSEHNLVTSDKDGEWCLGEWCPPSEVVLPAPFVNNYFYIKSLQRCSEIARIIGKDKHIPCFKERIIARKKALMAAYFNKWDGNFFGCLQGANAFAVDIGLGDERTYRNLVAHYRKTGELDTGIFGTDVLISVLFKNGDGQLATDLLLSESTHSFAEMKKRGATTLWEYWPESLTDRSHNHPMFGAVTAYLYDYLLGIRSPSGNAGYTSLEIAPVLVDQIKHISGHRTLPCGRVAVSYKQTDNEIALTVDVPEGVPATLVLSGKRYSLHAGKNEMTFCV